MRNIYFFQARAYGKVRPTDEMKCQQAIAGLRHLKSEGETWLARYSANPQLYLRAHIGSVVCGPLGPAGEKRFDVIGEAVNALFLLPSGDFVLSSALEQVLET